MARYAEIKIIYEGKDISMDVAPYLESFSFTDNSGDKADDISITLQDRDMHWINDWMPSKGDKVSCSVITHNWRQDGDSQELPCGEFEVDEISYKAPPRVLSIKATSVKVKGKAVREKHNKAWENVELKTICQDAAESNGLELFWDVDMNPMIERREQIECSDLQFVKGLCGRYDMSVKVSEGKLVIFSEEKYQDKAAIAVIKADDKGLITYSFTSKSSEVYSKAHVRYHHAVKDETFDVEEIDESVEGSERELEINERVESESEARSVAKKALSDKNRKEITGNITLLGNPELLAGVNVELSGFGMFDGKYAIESVTHNVTGGYTTQVNLTMGKESKTQNKSVKKAKQTSHRGKVKKGASGGYETIYAPSSETYGYKGE